MLLDAEKRGTKGGQKGFTSIRGCFREAIIYKGKDMLWLC